MNLIVCWHLWLEILKENKSLPALYPNVQYVLNQNGCTYGAMWASDACHNSELTQLRHEERTKIAKTILRGRLFYFHVMTQIVTNIWQCTASSLADLCYKPAMTTWAHFTVSVANIFNFKFYIYWLPGRLGRSHCTLHSQHLLFANLASVSRSITAQDRHFNRPGTSK